jgi:signal transduction histidine kinase
MSPEPSTVGGDQSVEELRRELAEARQREAATAEILKVISSSPTDLERVFAEIAASATRLCGAYDAVIRKVDGEVFRVVAHHGSIPPVDTLSLTREVVAGRAVLDRRTIHVADLQAETGEYPEGSDIARRLGFRTNLAVPLIRAGAAIGVINIRRTEVRPFTDRQIDLLKTFADQAVIAIENTRLFEAEQARTKELAAALEQQTATSEILGVISRSPTDGQSVFDSIVKAAVRLCGAEGAVIRRRNGDFYAAVASYGYNSEQKDYLLRHPVDASPNSVAGRAACSRATVYIPDILEDPRFKQLDLAKALRFRAMAAVPLLRENDLIGLLMLNSSKIDPFTAKQIELAETFADQAVIAIENMRLFEAEQASKRELTEALEQQTATADVLKVISRSALDLQRVLDALVESAARLCNAYDAVIFQVWGDGLRLVAHHGQIPTTGPVGQLYPLARDRVGARAVLDRRTIHITDILAEADEYPENRKNALHQGYRTALAVPLVHAGEAIGVIVIRRQEVRPFAERQIELVNTFADQAVIAIENTRLFNEIAQKSRELEIASQHKSQFVANMSHELRTPLAAMLGYAELLQEGIYGAPPEKFLPILTRIRSNGKHLLGLINTVLDISKIEAGQFKLNLAEYALSSIVETVMVATESLASTKKLAFKTEVAKGLAYGLGDEQRLTQVLLNLVGNAIKFTDAGEVRITAGAENGHFALSVSDTGPGIPAEECERIFEKFRQVDSSNTRAKGGTGLGLAITREIVEMHGGRIWVESTVGEGSTFRVELPVRAAAAAGAA